jgi:mannosyltransferase
MVNERTNPGSFPGALGDGGRPLLAIVAVALVARLIGANSELWTDEILALLHSFRLPLAEIITTFRGDNHHPLYAVFARISLVMFGESPWALRLPSVLFGTAAVAATYGVARLVAPRREALIASLLLAVSYHHVWFSQNARGYTLIGLLALVNTWILVRMLEQPSWRLAIVFALCAAAGAYTHLTMVFITIGQAMVALVALRRAGGGHLRVHWRVLAGAFVLAALFTVLLYAPMLDEVLNFFVNVPSELVVASTPAWALREAIRVLLFALGGPTAILAGVVLVTGTVVVIAGFVSIVRRNSIVALAFVFPPIAVLTGALLGRGTMYPRFFFFIAGSVVIVLVRGLFASSAYVKRRWPAFPATAPAVALAALLVAGSAASLTLNYRYPKQDFTGAMRFVLASKAPDDVVVFAGVTGEPYRNIHGQDWPTIASVAQMDSVRGARSGRLWLIYTFPRYLEIGAPDVAALVSRHCQDPTVFRGTVGGGEVLVCRFEPGTIEPA